MATEKYGAYGSSLESDWSYEVGVCESIKEIVIRYGWIVDGIGFAKLDALGATSSTQYFGGFGGDFKRIILKRNEYITRISGKHGNYTHHSATEPLVASLTIHTNLRPTGYGPFGSATSCSNVTHFSSPFQLTDNLVKLFGRATYYLLSIGIEVTNKGGSH
ncbi:unnamed protein product [Amaranthus hypochondriacus]